LTQSTFRLSWRETRHDPSIDRCAGDAPGAVIAYSSNTTTVIADDDPNGLVLTIARRTGTLSDTTPLVEIRTVG
jgi:hypothetical protein